MEKLAQILEDIVRIVANDVRELRDSDGFKKGIQLYLDILNPSIKRYQHHQGDVVSGEELVSRYEYETALLHVLTVVFSHSSSGHNYGWPAFEVNSPYNWYSVPEKMMQSIQQIADQLLMLETLELVVSEISDDVLRKTSSRYLGEFYTPLPIAEHLIDLSGFQPDKLFTGCRIVDPACGGGIILTSIVKKVVTYALSQGYDPKATICKLSQNIFGFDIQPFAVTITKSLLIHSCLPILSRSKYSEFDDLFPNIQLQDALALQNYWIEDEGFDYIIGNPPFMSIKKTFLDYIESYKEVLYGHPNLYQLFLWWAVQSAVSQGIISFVVPQSMLTGNYFVKLRRNLDIHTNIVSLTRMIDRTGIFDDADQQTMVICLQVTKDKSIRNGVNVRVIRNSTDLSRSMSCVIDHAKIMRQLELSSIWIVSDNTLDYEICEALEKDCTKLADLSQIIMLGNGGYVWNENKECLSQHHKDGALPLISAASVKPYEFTFPYAGSHSSRTRAFAQASQKTLSLVHTKPALLIQRVTPRKVGRRLVASVPSSKFFTTYPQYFLENHVNYARVADGNDQDLLYGLMGWLNSDLVNFAFQLRNGTSQVSLFELGLLPVNYTLLQALIHPAIAITVATGEQRSLAIDMLNRIVFNWFGLEASHCQRIVDSLNQREKAEVYV